MTGASRGLGRAVACALSAAGAHVVLAARTQGGIEETDDMIRASGGSATLCPLDLTAPGGIEDAARALGGRFGRLDILVGNAAALGVLTPVHQLEADVWERVISTNVTANRRLIRAFDPWLRRSAAGRAIFVTSGAAEGGLAYWGAYAASKAALEALVSCYAAETARTAMRVNLVDPGAYCAPTCGPAPSRGKIRRNCGRRRRRRRPSSRLPMSDAPCTGRSFAPTTDATIRGAACGSAGPRGMVRCR